MRATGMATAAIAAVVASTGVARAEDANAGERKAEATRTAGATQAQVPSFRGGSLGMPSITGGKVAQAAAVAKVGTEDAGTDGAVDVDFLSKLGGLNLFDKVYVDVIGESYQQALPQVTVGMAGALPTMVPTTMTGIGMRFRYEANRRPFDVFAYDVARGDEGRASEGEVVSATARQIFTGSTGNSYAFGAWGLHAGLPGNGADRIGGMAGEFIFQRTTVMQRTGDDASRCKAEADEATKAAKAKADAARTFAGQVSKAGAPVEVVEELKAVVEQADEDKTTAGKVAAACQNGDRRWSFYLSGSATYLRPQATTDDTGGRTEVPSFSELRSSAGIELQAGKEEIGLLLPRIGARTTISRASWTNPYVTDPAQATDIRAWQAEFAVYASGHFSGGASGVLSLGVLLPYGHDDHPQPFVIYSQSIGSDLGGGS